MNKSEKKENNPRCVEYWKQIAVNSQGNVSGIPSIKKNNQDRNTAILSVLTALGFKKG